MISTTPRNLISAMMAVIVIAASSSAGRADDFLNEKVEFEGQILFLTMNVPGMVLGVIRNGERVVVGFGDKGDGTGEPDGDTIIQVGSISKAFAGEVFASLVADGTVKFSDRLQDRLGWPVTVPTMNGREITLLDLATHGAGFPREAERVRVPATPDMVTREAYMAALKTQKLFFPPGTGFHYSNYAFDLLGEALAHTAKKPYSALLKERIWDPAGMKDTYLRLGEGEKRRLFIGHGPDGTKIENTDLSDMQAAASGVYSTANDILKWLASHLNGRGSETRILDHAGYVRRDGRNPVSGLDESGHMDAMGLGWIVMNAAGDRPPILQKSGGRQGTLSYVAFSPARGVGVFVSINKFDFAAMIAAAAAANHLIAELAPR